MPFSAPFDLKQESANVIVRSALRDHTVGAIIGSALGDAVGLYTEFLSADQAAISYPSRTFTLASPNPTPFKLDTHRSPKSPGDWTDDTDHALLLLLSYLHTASINGADPLPTPSDFASRLRIWVQQGLRALDTMPLGLGRLVGTVVATKNFAEEPEQVAREYWKRPGRRVAPNGSLMRTHPLGLMCLFRGEEETFAVAAKISRVTHYDPRCVIACVYGTALVRAVVRSEILMEEDINLLLRKVVVWYAGQPEVGPESLELDLAELEKHVKAESLDVLQLDEREAIGYVYKTLGAGVLLLRMAIRKTRESYRSLLMRVAMFEELITDLIMREGDADTNACFAGALLGAFLGYEALPDHWKHGLRHEQWLIGKAEALCQVLGLADGHYDGQEDKDTYPDGGRGFVSEHEMEGRWMVLQQTAFKKIEDALKATPKTRSRWSVPWPGKTEH